VPLIFFFFATKINHLGNLHLVAEVDNEVLVDNAVRGGEEGEDVRNEVALVVGHALPVRLQEKEKKEKKVSKSKKG